MKRFKLQVPLTAKKKCDFTQGSQLLKACEDLVRVFSDVLVAFLYFDICHYIFVSGKYQNMENPLKHQRRLGLVKIKPTLQLCNGNPHGFQE